MNKDWRAGRCSGFVQTETEESRVCSDQDGDSFISSINIFFQSTFIPPSTCTEAGDTLGTVTNKDPASWSTSDRIGSSCLGAEDGSQPAECLLSTHKAWA